MEKTNVPSGFNILGSEELRNEIISSDLQRLTSTKSELFREERKFVRNLVKMGDHIQ